MVEIYGLCYLQLFNSSCLFPMHEVTAKVGSDHEINSPVVLLRVWDFIWEWSLGKTVDIL